MPEVHRLGRLAAVILAFLLLMASSAVAGAPNPFRIWSIEMKRHGVEKKHPSTGVGSCTLVNTVPGESARTARAIYRRTGQINFVPDGYDCYGAKFAKFGVEFRRFPQPKDFRIANRVTTAQAPACVDGVFCRNLRAHALAPSAAVNPTAAYFPPFTHVVIIYHENHTFDDYLGDCATIYAGCNGVTQSTNHESSVPDLHTLASTYALSDAYSTGTQPPSGPNHWWLFSAQTATQSQQQAWPSAGTVFDRFIHGAGSGGPTNFSINGDIYWMANSVSCSGSRDPSSPPSDQSQTVSTSGGNGYYKPTGGSPSALPVDAAGTSYPEELHYSEYTCSNVSVGDNVVANDFLSSVAAHGLPTYSYVELFNDHPGSSQNIGLNDSSAYNIVNTILGNSAYKDNTLIINTEDDTQNGNNGPDHVSNTYRVPLVVMCSAPYCKQHYLSHVAYSTSNVVAAIERVVNNVHPGAIDPNNNLGPNTFPMTSADQSALGDPLGDFWVQGSTPLSASTTASPTTGNAPLNVTFTGSATGGTAPYTYSWNFGDGSAASTTQNPTHSYAAAGTYTATLTVTDAASPAHTATSTQTITVSNSTSPLSATASGNPTSGQIPLTTNFTGSAAGGTRPYSYGWNFGDAGSSSNTSTAQNPSHTYNNQGTYTATLTVSDSASPVHTATSTVSVTASPIASTPPGAPTGLTATAGTGQVSLNWTAPSSTGGQTLTAYTMYRGTSSGSETKLTAGGCSGLNGTTVTCTDSGLTAGTTYFYKVTASNPTGEGPQSGEASATPTGASSCTASQLIGNPGFETGTASPWTATSGVLANSTSEPPHSGTWDAWIDGYSAAHTDTLSQSFTIPTGCNTSTLSFWLHIDTAHTGTSVIDTLKVQLLNSAGTVLTTLATYSNLDKNTGYVQKSFNVGSYAGQGAITLKLTGVQANSVQTSFVTDDYALNTSGSGGTANMVTVTNPGSQTSTAAMAIAPVQIQATDSASGQMLTYTASGLPAGLSISSSGQITGTPTTAGTSSVTVTATDTSGASGATTFNWTVNPASGGCTAAQLLANPGFESGPSQTAWAWTSTLSTASQVFNSSSSEPPHGGTYDAWLNGWGQTDTDTVAQSAAIPSTCKNATLSFWLHINTAEITTTTKYDTLTLQILNSSGAVLSTPGNWSNLDHNTGYKQWSVSLAAYVGQTITVKFTGSEDASNQTSFVLDDTALNVS
jgi:PKD repeat protein